MKKGASAITNIFFDCKGSVQFAKGIKYFFIKPNFTDFHPFFEKSAIKNHV